MDTALLKRQQESFRYGSRNSKSLFLPCFRIQLPNLARALHRRVDQFVDESFPSQDNKSFGCFVAPGISCALHDPLLTATKLQRALFFRVTHNGVNTGDIRSNLRGKQTSFHHPRFHAHDRSNNSQYPHALSPQVHQNRLNPSHPIWAANQRQLKEQACPVLHILSSCGSPKCVAVQLSTMQLPFLFLTQIYLLSNSGVL